MPNLITLFRILIVPFFFSTLLYYETSRPELRWWSFGLFLVASVTDALDGLLARLRNQTTEMGRFLDPLADKLLIISGFVGVCFAKGFPMVPPLWVVVTIVFRDFVIIGGMVVFFVSNSKVEVAPNFLGKTTTAFQMATMLSILLLLPISPILWNATACLTILSGAVYVARAMRRGLSK